MLSFWDGHGEPPENQVKLISELRRRMSGEKTVRKRVKFLSKKLVDLLKFFLRGEGYRAELGHVTGSKTFAYLSPFELKAAVNALIKRGFLFEANGQDNGRAKNKLDTFLVPCELGDVLQAFIWDDDRSVEEIFSLRGQLARLVDRGDLDALVGRLLKRELHVADHAEATELLAQKVTVAERLAGVPESYHPLLAVVVQSYGGIGSRTELRKNEKGHGRWNRKELQTALEGNLLGTVRHVSLGEFGIHQFDEMIVLYAEVVEPLRELLGVKEPEISMQRSLGVDLISDISAFLSHVEHNPIKLTLSGKIYRTAVRKLEDQFILTRTSGFSGEWLFQYLYDFCHTQSMIARTDERSVELTIKGRSWDRTPLDTKLTRLLKFSVMNWTASTEPFHGEQLLELYLDRLRELPPGKWVHIDEPAFDARNRYLAALDNLGVRDRFQSRYQFAQQSGMRDPQQLAKALSTWGRERLFLFGLLDVGLLDNRPSAMRLTPLGAKALGVEMPEGEATDDAPLVVNPDFEVILFPNADSYDLITELDHFAERVSSDSAYRYKLTEASIEKAVADGMQAADILRTLSEHSRVEIPQNVIYSIGQWAEKVKFVSHAQVTLLRGRSKEVVDRMLHDEELRRHVVERLSPTALIVSSALPRDELAALLEPLGVFLDESDG
ncbi:MAG: hypothetical protein DHS20C15_02100 [Planctomycetota bacterium]|nr:MAG: hypothetical protein DHS20C15_02100 [Planctomycetota bacterium]